MQHSWKRRSRSLESFCRKIMRPRHRKRSEKLKHVDMDETQRKTQRQKKMKAIAADESFECPACVTESVESRARIMKMLHCSKRRSRSLESFCRKIMRPRHRKRSEKLKHVAMDETQRKTQRQKKMKAIAADESVECPACVTESVESR